MSNIGKQPISITEGVEVSRKDDNIFVKGKLGELNQEFKSDIQISINDNEVVVARNSDEKIQRELHGLTRVLIANMVEGVSQGFQKELNLVGVGYTADASKGLYSTASFICFQALVREGKSKELTQSRICFLFLTPTTLRA